jgi:FKBP-type peptidyl-prolyl cis-trans isomerase FkpA
MKFWNATLLIGLAILAVSCGSYSEEEKSAVDMSIQNYLATKKIKCTKSESGLYYKIIEEGEGDFIQFKDEVSFKYKGEFLDGEVFDNRMDSALTANVTEQIAAWKELMLQLKKGSKAFMVVPPHLGYGPYEIPAIPSNSILVFNLEIVDVK